MVAAGTPPKMAIIKIGKALRDVPSKPLDMSNKLV